MERRDRAGPLPDDEGRRGVAQRSRKHRQRADDLPAALHSDEQGDAHEADPDACEPYARRALRRVEPDREQHGEDRRRRLDHPGEPGADPGLGEAEQPERQRVVEQAQRRHDREIGPQQAEASAARGDRQQDRRADDEPPERHDRGLELVYAELDEEERGAPDRREGEEERTVAARHVTTLVAPLGGRAAERVVATDPGI